MAACQKYTERFIEPTVALQPIDVGVANTNTFSDNRNRSNGHNTSPPCFPRLFDPPDCATVQIHFEASLMCCESSRHVNLSIAFCSLHFRFLFFPSFPKRARVIVCSRTQNTRQFSVENMNGKNASVIHWISWKALQRQQSLIKMVFSHSISLTD